MLLRDITMDDMKDVTLPIGATLWDALLATAARAKEILEEEGAAAKARTKRTPSAAARAKEILEEEEAAARARPKRSRERTPAAAARISDDEYEYVAASKRRRPISPNINGRQGDEPPLPQEFRKVIEEVAGRRNAPPPEARMLIQKRLFKTDTNQGHNRLSIPIGQIKDDFLTEEEKRRLASYDENRKKKFVEVTILEPSLRPETVKFSRWDMPKKNGGKTSSSYVINGKWNDIVEKNGLKEGMMVQLWCFRVHRDLCFALVRLRA